MQTYVLAVLVDLVIKDRGLWDVAVVEVDADVHAAAR